MTANRIILGTAKLGLEGRESAFELLDAYVEMGGTEIDTASVYSDWVPGEPGRSETVIGEWMRARGNREAVVIHTKGAHPPIGDMHQPRSDAATIRHDVELSLRRLGVERLDLWYLHRDDLARSVADLVGPVHELIREGKVKTYGVSNWSADRIDEALALDGPKPVANQPLGNMMCQVMGEPSDDTLAVFDAPMLRQGREHGITLNLFTSQCAGLFERRKAGKPAPKDYDKPACADAASRIEEICAREGLPVSHVILAFLLHLGPHVRALIGPRNASQFRDNYAAGELSLQSALVRELAEVARMGDFL